MLSDIILVSKGHDSKETNISLNPNYGSLIPDPLISGSFDMIWWNLSDYINPSEDPYAEIVKCIARYDDNLIIMRSQQGTSISDKNIPNKIYGMSILSDYTSTISNSNTINTNIFKNLSYYNISQIHGKTRHDSSTLDGGTILPLDQLPVHGSSQHTGTIGVESQIAFSTTGHYHTGSDSKKVDHLNLLNIGTNSHTQIDTHIGTSSAHGTGSPIVGSTDIQTLTNKTITDSTNNVMAKSLKSATTTIDVSSASAPSSGQVLTATGNSTATWQTLTSPSIGSKSQYFTSNDTFSVPTGVTLVWVTLWGGGGGGGAGNGGGTGGGGGGSGEAIVQKPVNVTSGANITVTIGNGGNGAAGGSGSTGNDGTATSFGSVTANPGKGGIGNGAGGVGGGVLPGTGGAGNSTGVGGNGNVGTFRGQVISGSGGGGYGNSPGGNGGPFPPFIGGLYNGYGGGGAAGYNGNGALGGYSATANSGAGGGGAAGNGTTGNGASGGCLVEWIG